mmetsp:Transcript_35166/g.101280  ORF Transcript_35166/g.101280 Transcript_35166/m.101280 type:complete len:210 (-) Transcript_35166:1080-1709(-)
MPSDGKSGLAPRSSPPEACKAKDHSHVFSTHGDNTMRNVHGSRRSIGASGVTSVSHRPLPSRYGVTRRANSLNDPPGSPAPPRVYEPTSLAHCTVTVATWSQTPHAAFHAPGHRSAASSVNFEWPSAFRKKSVRSTVALPWKVKFSNMDTVAGSLLVRVPSPKTRFCISQYCPAQPSVRNHGLMTWPTSCKWPSAPTTTKSPRDVSLHS